MTDHPTAEDYRNRAERAEAELAAAVEKIEALEAERDALREALGLVQRGVSVTPVLSNDGSGVTLGFASLGEHGGDNITWREVANQALKGRDE